MSETKLHPTVIAFKTFINKHPKLIEEIRKNGRSWQEYYEKWVLLGEDDPMWETYKKDEGKGTEAKKGKSSNSKKNEIFSQIMKAAENLDIDKVQGQVQQLNSVLSTLQELFGQFQHTKKSNETPMGQPFGWHRD